jgi:hypothetical protein
MQQELQKNLESCELDLSQKFDRFVSIWMENQDYNIAAGYRTSSAFKITNSTDVKSFNPMDRKPRNQLE